MVDILPAILCQTKSDLAAKVAAIPSAPALHIDLMDGKFVQNKTVGPDELDALPAGKIIEYHLMVSEPVEWIEKLKGGKNTIFEVHAEAIGDEKMMDEIARAVHKKQGKLALVLNPPTPIKQIEAHLHRHSNIGQVLVMTVNPGWAGQSYIREMEEKMKALRAAHPHLIIEVDGGVGMKTAPGARAAGANRFAAANALFKNPNPEGAYQELKTLLNP